LIALATIVISLIAIGIHYEALRLASSRLMMAHVKPRLRVALAVIVALIAHLLEVVVFAVALWLLLHGGWGSLFPANYDPETVLYFSLVCYTSLGFGDIIAEGPLRIFIGVEALLGLVMIGWTASFTYLEMRLYWLSDKALANEARAHGSNLPRLDG
jgi:hypothetical protein